MAGHRVIKDFAALGEIATLQRGFDITKAEQQPGDVPVVSSSGVSSYHNRPKVGGPAVVIGRKGTLGTVHWIPTACWPHDTSLYVRDFHGNNERFVYYLLRTMHLERFDCGGANPTLNRNHVHGLLVPRPTRDVQDRIAATLAAYDELIDVNERRAGLLEESVQLIYREWFERLRFPGHGRDAMVDGLPKGWRRARLDDVAAINERTLSPRGAPAVVAYIDISSVSTGRVDAQNEMPFATAPSRARRLVRDGDILWSTVRPERRSYALLTDPAAHVVVSTGFAVLSPKTVPPSWLYAAVTNDRFVAYMAGIARGTAYPAVTGTDFGPVSLLVPPDDLLAAFDAIAAPTYRQIHTLNQQSRALALARDVLLPRLIDGTLNPPDDITPDPAAK